MDSKIQIAKLHLTNAEDELRISETILYKSKPEYWAAAFHAQQCVEEVLKSLLSFHGIKAEETNNINDLIQLGLPVLPDLEKFGTQARTLKAYAGEPHSPAQYEYITQKEAEEAIDIAHKIFESVSSFMQEIS